jgi:hypothetical protein
VVPGQYNVPATYQMSFDIQRKLASDTLLDVAYVGNLSRHLASTRQINGVPYGAQFLPQNQDPTTGTPLNDNFFRPIYGYAGMSLLDFSGTSNYNSLQTQVKRRLSRDLQFSAAWTWSKAMAIGSQATGSGAANTGTLPAFNDRRFWSYAPVPWDRTHTLVANWVWDLPRATRLINNKLVGWAFNNWQASGVTSFISGVPTGVALSLSDGANLTGGGDGGTVRMNGVAVLPKDQRTFTRFFNTSVFSRPLVGDRGSGAAASLYAFRGPGINNWNMSFSKKFSFKEKVSLQFRGELYNIFNHTQFNSVNTTATFAANGTQTNSAFGQLTGTEGARSMQFTLRLVF